MVEDNQAMTLRCSAKRCLAPAVYELRWNNPKLHPPERRKTWLACAEHREPLSAFLTARAFLREVETLPAGEARPEVAGPPDAEALPDAEELDR